MVAIESELRSVYQWLFVNSTDDYAAILHFGMIVGGLALVALVLGYIIAAVRHGPMAGGDITYRVVTKGLRELAFISRRRTFALAWLAVKESVRKHVLIGLIVYIVFLAFAGWFLDSESADPVALYLSAVLAATSYLVLLMGLFLSAFSLPGDIKNRTIYTVVTKPVLAGEVVLGRLLGFAAVGTAMLAIMAVLSYFFVVRSLHHTHEIDPKSLTAAKEKASVSENESETPDADATSETADDEKKPRRGKTTSDLYHEHGLVLRGDGTGYTNTVKGHHHLIEDKQIGPPIDMFQARVPKYGKLRFLDRKGQPAPRGISVGSEWDYRSFVEGGTPAAAIWTFSDLKPDDYPVELPLEMYVRVYRSHKGEIEQGILGSIAVRNPSTRKQSPILQTFRAKEYDIDRMPIPRLLKIPDENGVLREVDLFAEYMDAKGDMEIVIRCLDRAQYFGFAQPDIYLRQEGGIFELNFLKGYVGIWAQMMLVICLGVFFSTFLSGPVAMIATAGCIVLGYFSGFIFDMVAERSYGGGPFESLIRLVAQMNVMTELEPTLGVRIAQTLDKVALFFMGIWVYVLPDFGDYDRVEWVARGYDIPADLIWQQVLSVLGFMFGVLVAGYFCLRIREVAK